MPLQLKACPKLLLLFAADRASLFVYSVAAMASHMCLFAAEAHCDYWVAYNEHSRAGQAAAVAGCYDARSLTNQ